MPECTATKEQIIEARNLLWPDGPPEQIPMQQCLRVAQALADRDAAIARVRDLHAPLSEFGSLQDCAECVMSSGQGVSWPCPTIQALDGEGGSDE